MIPGQLGPMSLETFCLRRACFTFTISCWGIPSVMQTINSISAATASRIASAAKGGGTYMTEAVHPVWFLASLQSLNTGRPRWVDPAFLGFTPPTIFVPYLRACSVWKVPFFREKEKKLINQKKNWRKNNAVLWFFPPFNYNNFIILLPFLSLKASLHLFP